MDMDTDVLRWFQQVADGMTVTEVSELEAVTQSGVSRALARLETEIGTPLLRRSGRTLRMTSAGAAFKRHVDAMIHQLDDGLAAVSQLVDPETGSVSLSFQLSLGTWLVPALVSSFRAAHPDVSFELKHLRHELVTSELGRGRVDLELSTVRPADPQVRWRRLLVEPLRLAVPRDHRLRRRVRVGLAELADEGFIALRHTSSLRKLSEDLCAEAGFAPRFAFEGDDLPMVTGFVAAGLGVAVVPAPRVWSGTADNVHYLELTDENAVREIGLAWLTDHPLLPAAALFRRHVVDLVAAGRVPALADVR